MLCRHADELAQLASEGPYAGGLHACTAAPAAAVAAKRPGCNDENSVVAVSAADIAASTQPGAADGGGGSAHFAGTPMMAAASHGTDEASGASGGGGKGGGEGSAAARVVGMHTPAHAVCRFLNAALACLLPPALYGGPANARVLAAHIGRFVRLRRFEGFTLHEAMQGLSTAAFPPPVQPQTKAAGNLSCSGYLGGVITTGSPVAVASTATAVCRQREQPTQLRWRQNFLGQLVDWVLSALVVPLIRTAFYATECEVRGMQARRCVF